jgi:hypothetical protein
MASSSNPIVHGSAAVSASEANTQSSLKPDEVLKSPEERIPNSRSAPLGPAFLYSQQDLWHHIPGPHSKQERKQCFWMKLFLTYSYNTYRAEAEAVINTTLTEANPRRPLNAPSLSSWEEVLAFIREANASGEKEAFKQVIYKQEYLQPIIDLEKQRKGLVQGFLKMSTSPLELGMHA